MFKMLNFTLPLCILYFFLFNINACKIYSIRYGSINKSIFFAGVVNYVGPTYSN